ncbi:hypothetical protein QNN00_10695 [Bacillus velezensis]|nr:hypothetical protein [Bacillus velezensis]
MNGVKPEAILIDQFAEPGIYFKHLSGRDIVKEKTFSARKRKAYIFPSPRLYHCAIFFLN